MFFDFFRVLRAFASKTGSFFSMFIISEICG